MTRLLRNLLQILLQTLLLGCLAAAAAMAQVQQPQAPPAAEGTSGWIAARIDEVKNDAALAADARTALLETWGSALEAAKAAESLAADGKRFTALREAAQPSLAERKRELDTLANRAAPDVAGNKSLSELEQGLAKAQQEQADAVRTGTELDKEVARRAERRNAIPGQLEDLKKRLEALPPPAADAAGAEPRTAAAQRALRLALRARTQTEIDTLTAEAADYDAEDELLRVRRDVAGRRATAAKGDAAKWQEAVQLARVHAAEKEKAKAEQKVEATTEPAARKIAEETAALADRAKDLARQLASAEKELLERRNAGEELQKDFDDAKKRVAAVGRKSVIGTMLRQRRALLNEKYRSTQQRTRSRQDRIAEVMLRQLDYERDNEQLSSDPRGWALHELGDQPAAAQDRALDEAVRLGADRKAVVELLTNGSRTLVSTLTSIEDEDHAFADRIATYRSFIAEHVLGIRSSPPVWHVDPADAAAAGHWLLAEPWFQVGAMFLADATDDVWPLLLLVVLLLAAFARPLWSRRLCVQGERGARLTVTSYAPTALALVDTVLIALPLPALLWMFGWRLAAHPDCSEFGKGLAAGAEEAAVFAALIAALRATVRPQGLAESHFRWQPNTIDRLRRGLPLLLPAALPLTLLLAALETHGVEAWLGSLGALALILQLLLILAFAWLLLHPRRGIVGGSSGAETSAQYRFRWLWFALGAGVPAVLLLMVVFGYDYTVLQLTRRCVWTLGVLAGGVLLHGLIVRKLLLERRRLQIRRSAERLEAARARGEKPPDAIPAEEVSPHNLAQRTQTLLRGAITIAVVVVVYQVWIDVLPAFGLLRGIELWSSDQTHITLSDLLLSLFLLVASFAASHSVPALLELLVLQRLRMQAGERVAVATLTQYGIVIVGILLAFNNIGLGWSKVQWLVAAVSVGLGFGLQEIFANFVSGLILLFERPIRVGDIVTIGDTTGRVLRIRIRATTIQNWDRKELVVPNREFVTGHFVNWTLTDSVVRWTIPVGVAYGTDSQKALQLLQRVAEESPHVLREPRAEAVFVGFLDSALDLQLRLFVDMTALDWRWMTDLHQAIERLFREHGIDIAFPQRDVNLKLAAPVLELLQREGGRLAAE